MTEKSKDSNEREERLLKAKSDALRLLSFRPRSVEEMRSRLKMKRFAADIIDDVLDSFQKQGLLNDAQFADLYAQSRIYTRPSGKRQVEQDLKKKGVSSKVVAETMQKLGDYDEKKAARDLVYTRFMKMTGVTRERKKARLFSFLQRRGFSTSVIFSVLQELFSEIEET
jgi:regulatory protein